VLADRASNGQDMTKICRAVFVRRCADSDELIKAVIDCFLDVGCEYESTGLPISSDLGFKPGFIDGDVSVIQASDPGCIDVVTDNVIAHLGHTSTGNKANIA